MSFRTPNANKIYVSILGGAAAASIAYYALTFSDVRGPVPMRYDIRGRAGNFVNKRCYIFYPIITASLAGTGYLLRDTKTIAVSSADQPAVWGIMLSTVLLSLAGQVVAHRIVTGKSKKFPEPILIAGLLGIAVGIGYCVMNAVSK